MTNCILKSKEDKNKSNGNSLLLFLYFRDVTDLEKIVNGDVVKL